MTVLRSTKANPIFITQGVTRLKTPRGLPLLVPWQKKWAALVIVMSFCCGLYFFTNHLPFFPPSRFHLSLADKLTPFIPATVWIYASYYFYIPFVFYLNRCIVGLHKLLYSLIFTFTVSALIFWACPITFPRELFPIPADTDSVSHFLLSWIRLVDTPINTAPSLHASISFQLALIFLEDLKSYFPYIFSWAVLISLSTLTTKQHYFIDMISGLGLALFAHWLFYHRLSYYFPNSTARVKRK